REPRERLGPDARRCPRPWRLPGTRHSSALGPVPHADLARRRHLHHRHRRIRPGRAAAGHPADLDVTAALAGQLVSVFALTSAIAGPILGATTSAWEQRRVIMAALATFILGNLLNAVAPTYAMALGGRVIAALGGCLLGAAVTGYVVHLVAERHRGRALSFVLGGWMTATALGVPVGLILGQSSWRLPLLLVSTVGFVALLGIGLRLPPLRYPSSSLADRL